MIWTSYLVIALGGALGAVLRIFIADMLPISILGNIPFQILFINMIGCFMMGLMTEIMSLYWTTSPLMRAFLIPGLLGGFTTFSAFSLEFGLLVEKNLYGSALFYAILSVTLSLGFFFVAIKLIRFLQ